MKIDLPEEIIEFMRNLASEIKSQDNRGTRAPIYYVVMGQRETCAPAGHGAVRYHVSKWDSTFTKDALREFIEETDEDNGTTTNFDDFVAGGECEEYSAAYVDVEDNIFLTFKGYEQHMDLNGHNYRHLKDPHSYVKYAGRNPEMEMLHKAIMAFSACDTQETP